MVDVKNREKVKRLVDITDKWCNDNLIAIVARQDAFYNMIKDEEITDRKVIWHSISRELEAITESICRIRKLIKIEQELKD